MLELIEEAGIADYAMQEIHKNRTGPCKENDKSRQYKRRVELS
jgi:hypothetical protein